MCGIFGALSINNYFNSRDWNKFLDLTNLVSYRGPDALGTLSINIKENTFNNPDKFDVFLGHRRLSIIDLSDSGTQPLTDGKGLWIVFNGEIFNYLELKKELMEKGHEFNTKTDTEVILKIYAEYGDEGFSKLNGMWAFALLDLPKKVVILSRDRFSIKPLYFTQSNNEIYFASEIKQLLPFLKKEEINHNLMFSFLSQGCLNHTDQTFFQNIKKIKSKHNFLIKLDNGKIEEKKYWDYNLNNIYNREDAFEQFRELFIDSVKIRLRSDVRVGALLSGGLDSSAISVIADYLQNGNFDTYTIIAEDKKYSEEKFVDILSSEKGIKNHKLSYQQNEALDSLQKVIYHQDEPFGGFSIVAEYKILEKIKKETNIVVILSGQGGDEILMGYLKYYFFNLKESFKQGKFIEAFKQIFLSLIHRTVLSQFRLSEAKRYLPAFLPFGEKITSMPFLLKTNKYEPIWDFHNITHRQILDIDKYSIPAITHYEDRNSMAHSLEIRLPFLDHRLVNFALSLATEMKIHNGWTKYILRKSISELPEAIKWRKDKQGFITPEENWIKNDFRDQIYEVFRKSILEQMGIINSKIFLEFYDNYLNGKRTILYSDISRVFIAELWARRFLK